MSDEPHAPPRSAKPAHTPGPWKVRKAWATGDEFEVYPTYGGKRSEIGDWAEIALVKGNTVTEARRNAALIASAPDMAAEITRLRAEITRLRAEVEALREALDEGRRAIGDHHAPNDCYATGPVTGDPYRDLVECPACSFIAMYEKAVARAALRGGGEEAK